jgi:osmotically inducible lipoprotein OsmB
MPVRTVAIADPPCDTSGGRPEHRCVQQRPEGTQIMTTRSLAPFVLLAALALGASGCGYNRGERALSGAGIGAAGGAIIGAVAGGNPATGALIGGGVGALGGALTSPRQLNLGRPIWR